MLDQGWYAWRLRVLHVHDQSKGKVVVRTYGVKGLYVTVTVTAVPKKGSPVVDSATWKRKWRVS